jgi:hypothetical protein
MNGSKHGKEPDNDSHKTVVLLGLARSGTSTITGVLHLLGVDMGAREYADKWNPMGSFEDRDFQKLHKEIFDRAGEGMNYWNPPSYESLMGLRNELAPRIKSFIAEKAEGKMLWGWKHTRTILTIDLFLEHLRNPHFVIVYRNPLTTAQSSVKHTQRYEDKVDFHRALNLVHFYHGELLRFYEKHPELPRTFVAYEQLVDRPREEAQRIAEFLGISPGEKDMNAIEAFVLPGDRLEKEKARSRSFLGGALPRFLRKHGLR